MTKKKLTETLTVLRSILRDAPSQYSTTEDFGGRKGNESEGRMAINMLQKKQQVIIRQMLIFVGLFLIGLLSVLRVGNHPGLYADAVMPDYIGIRLLNPSTINATTELPNLGIPLLGQVYHGTATMFFSMIATIITGTTSMLQLRILNCIYGTIACFVIYRILKLLDTNKIISVGVPFALAASPNLTSMYRTQYYIFLIGNVCLLAAILFFIKWSKSTSESKNILVAGVFSGLAFYNYFCFLFCIPGFVVALLCYSKRRKESFFSNFIAYVCGCALGELPGIIGYVGFCIQPVQGITLGIKRIISILFCVVYILAIVSSYRFSKKKSTRKYAFGILGAVAIGLGFMALALVVRYSDHMKSLNLGGTDFGLVENVKYFLRNIAYVLCYSCEEYLVLNTNVCIGLKVIVVTTAILTVIAIAAGIQGKRNNTDVLLMVSGVFVLCPLSAIFLITRLAAHHFTVLFFLMYLLLGISLDTIICGKHQASTGFRIERMGLAFIFIVMVALGEFNQTRIKLRFDDDPDNMNRYYSDSIRIVSEEALSAAEKDVDELYVFPKWGYMFGFAYLTRNVVPYVTSVDAPYIKECYDKGYAIKVCYFEDNEEEPLQYIETLSNILGTEAIIERRTVQCWGEDATMIVVLPIGD